MRSRAFFACWDLPGGGNLPGKEIPQEICPGGTVWDEDHPANFPRRGTFIHWEYHPKDIGRRVIRQVFESTLAPALRDSQVPTGQLTIAFSTPQSLGNCLTKTQLTEPNGYEVSLLAEPLE